MNSWKLTRPKIPDCMKIDIDHLEKYSEEQKFEKFRKKPSDEAKKKKREKADKRKYNKENEVE